MKEKVIGLTGPSGVGKGYTKAAIKEYFRGKFSEPIVATTRPKRDTDQGDRLAGLSIYDFNTLVEKNQILFPHQPFGVSGDWYGFLTHSFHTGNPTITEIHVDNISQFRAQFGASLSVVAFTADTEYLRRNLTNRKTETEESIELRILSAIDEVRKILEQYQKSEIDHLIQVSDDNRNTLKELAINAVLSIFSINKE